MQLMLFHANSAKWVFPDEMARVGDQLDERVQLNRAWDHGVQFAGFGIRTAAQVATLAPHCDGVVVGSALVRTLLDGGDPAATLRGLRPTRSAA